VAGAFDLLDEEVQALGGPVRGAGGVMGQDLCTPPVEGPAKGPDLFDGVGAAPFERLSRSSWNFGGDGSLM
jgi:hypothetical protein